MDFDINIQSSSRKVGKRAAQLEDEFYKKKKEKHNKDLYNDIDKD